MPALLPHPSRLTGQQIDWSIRGRCLLRLWRRTLGDLGSSLPREWWGALAAAWRHWRGVDRRGTPWASPIATLGGWRGSSRPARRCGAGTPR